VIHIVVERCAYGCPDRSRCAHSRRIGGPAPVPLPLPPRPSPSGWAAGESVATERAGGAEQSEPQLGAATGAPLASTAELDGALGPEGDEPAWSSVSSEVEAVLEKRGRGSGPSEDEGGPSAKPEHSRFASTSAEVAREAQLRSDQSVETATHAPGPARKSKPALACCGSPRV
jgi:hypothetical protein